MSVFPGEKHHTATVLLISTEEISRTLLMYHKKFKVWMPPGGHVEKTENDVEAAIREVKEEIGLDVGEFFKKPVRIDVRGVDLHLPEYVREYAVDAHGQDPAHFHIDSLFVVHLPFQAPPANPSEPNIVRWFTKDEIQTIATFENVRTVLNEHM